MNSGGNDFFSFYKSYNVYFLYYVLVIFCREHCMKVFVVLHKMLFVWFEIFFLH